jgi:hypothetical protein
MALEGNLETFYLSSLFQLLSNDKKTGKLRITHDDDVVTVHFFEGTIVSATSTDNEKHLGYLLRSEGIIGDIELEKHLLIARNRKERLGKVLVDECFISKEELDKVIRMQVENILFGLFHWLIGKFRFDECQISVPEDTDTQFETMELILEASRRVDEMSVLEKKIPAKDQILRYTADAAAANRQTKLNQQENAVLRLVNGMRTIKEIMYQSGYDEFTSVKALYTLLSAGIIDVKEKIDLSLQTDVSQHAPDASADSMAQKRDAADLTGQQPIKSPGLHIAQKKTPGGIPKKNKRFFSIGFTIIVLFALASGAVLFFKMGGLNALFRTADSIPVQTRPSALKPLDETEQPAKNLTETQSMQDKNSFFFLNLPAGFTYTDTTTPRKSLIAATYAANITVEIEAKHWSGPWNAEDEMYKKIAEFQDSQSGRARAAIESHGVISIGGGQGYKITSAETINAALCMTHLYRLVGYKKIISIQIMCKNCKQPQTSSLFSKVDETIKKSLLIYP